MGFALLRTTSENRPHRKEGKEQDRQQDTNRPKKKPRKKRFQNEVLSMMN